MTNPFDSIEIAKKVRDGHTVRLGEFVVIWKDGHVVVLQCMRCHVENRIARNRMQEMLDLDELAKFIFVHLHQDLPS